MPPPSTGPTTGTARIAGRVTGAETGQPLRRAQISLASSTAAVRRTTTTDGDGKYVFEDLPAGRYSLNVAKAGYVTLQFGQRRPLEPGTPIAIAEGETMAKADVALQRGGVIVARITDEFGEPIAQASVQVQRFVYGPDGQRRPQPVNSSTTDDLGHVRLYGLPPGDYVVSAFVRNISVMVMAATNTGNEVSEGYASTYYPGTLNVAEAQTVTVSGGDEGHIAFALVPSRLVRIAGTVVDSEGRPAAGAMINIRSTALSYGAGQVQPDGSFSVSNIPPGEMTLDVRTPPRPGVRGESASMPLVVGDRNLTGIRLVLSGGNAITGRVIFDGSAPRTALAGPVRVFPSPVEPGGPRIFFSDPLAEGSVREDGSFEIAGVSGRVYLTVNANPAWMVKSVTVDGDDVTDRPVEIAKGLADVRIVLTDKLTDVSGRVIDSRGQEITEYVIVLQPEAVPDGVQAGRLIRVARPDTNARFQIRGIRPGRYIATAVEWLEQGQQFAPEVQTRLRAGGEAVTVREGQAVTVDLRLSDN